LDASLEYRDGPDNPPSLALTAGAIVLGLTATAGVFAQAKPRTDKRPSTETRPMTAPLPRIGFVSFYVLDLKRSLSFYVEQLGMREQNRIPLPNGIVEIVLGFGDQPGIILMYNEKRKTPYELGDGFSRFAVHVGDIRSLVQRLSEQGVRVMVQPTTVEQLKLTYALVRDPDGYVIEFLQRT
jgi:lactoylglutathione lyase